MEYSGRTALITGASAGIGEAFARSYASKGANIVLAARRENRLQQVADELKGKYGVKTWIIPCDLYLPEAPDQIFAQTLSDSIEIDILVNNAGMGLPGNFLDYEWSKHRAFLELMALSYVHMTRLFLPGMIERGYGRIIQVASVAGLVPGSSGHTLYGASKALLISYSESLASECFDKGVHVSALCPGFTYTEFHDVNNTREIVSKLPKWMFMEAGPVVSQGIAAVEERKVVCVPGVINKLLVALIHFLPRSWMECLVRRNSKRFRKAHIDAKNPSE